MKDTELPVIEEYGTVSKFVHFIIKGQIYIMNKQGLYEYGTLGAGSYFGDISVLQDKPNTFSYFYNPQGDSHVILLSVKREAFREIIDTHPLAKDILTRNAEKRLLIFEEYKSLVLLKYMKHIVKNPFLVNQRAYTRKNYPFLTRVLYLREEQLKVKLTRALLDNFVINKVRRKHHKNNSDEEGSRGSRGSPR
jgi:CRP-like cAMP-binding protein